MKLDVVGRYLKSYTTALRKTPFRKAYIDAFAGTGYRDAPLRDSSDQELLFPDLAEDAPQGFLDGSARLALKVEPRFDRYIFIEKNSKRCRGLEALKQEFPLLSDDILVQNGEANAQIRELCSKDWGRRRAVLFLDPYGMQVEWGTIEAIASTAAIDLWLLFPLGIGVNRLLKRSGKLPIEWHKRLDVLLGTEDWYDEFYKKQVATDLFGNEEEVVLKATMDSIGAYFNARLGRVFAGVASRPGVLRNRANNPLYLLCFAVGNKRGKRIALNIANYLLKDMQ